MLAPFWGSFWLHFGMCGACCIFLKIEVFEKNNLDGVCKNTENTSKQKPGYHGTGSARGERAYKHCKQGESSESSKNSQRPRGRITKRSKGESGEGLALLKLILTLLRVIWGLLGVMWGLLRLIFGPPGAFLRAPGALLGSLWGASWTLQDPPKSLPEALPEAPRTGASFLNHFGNHFGSILRPPGLQKTRFSYGGCRIFRKIEGVAKRP